MAWKKYLTGVMAVILLAAFPGCEKPQTEAPSYDAAETHILETTPEGISVDADILGMPEDGALKVYEGILKAFSQEEIDAFLTVVGDTLVETREQNVGGDLYRYGTCASGSNLTVAINTDGSFPTSELFYYNKEESKWYDAYPIYISQDDYDQGADLRLAHLFTEPKDFRFGTAQEVEERIREALGALGLSDLILNRVLYLDHEAMAEAGRVVQEEKYAPIKENDPGFPVKEDWSQEDDGYMFEFFCGIHGAALCHKFFSFDTRNYLGNTITVWYQETGIVNMEIHYPWVPGAVAEEPAETVTAREALELASKKLGAIQIYQDTVITKVSLEYMYESSGDGWLLKPVWIVCAEYGDDRLPGFTLYEYVLVDAVTGEEI